MKTNLMFNLFVSVIHFTFCFLILTICLISNNINVLTVCLILMILTKLCFWMFDGRCVLSLYETNPHSATTVQIFAKTLTHYKMQDAQVEEIVINGMTILILNKILILALLPHYKCKLPFGMNYLST